MYRMTLSCMPFMKPRKMLRQQHTQVFPPAQAEVLPQALPTLAGAGNGMGQPDPLTLPGCPG